MWWDSLHTTGKTHVRKMAQYNDHMIHGTWQEEWFVEMPAIVDDTSKAAPSAPGLEDDVRELRRQLFEQQSRIRDLEQRSATQDREYTQLKDSVRRVVDDAKRRRLG